MSKKIVTRFDAADYLDSEEAMVAYLNAAMEEDDPDILLAAMADVAKAVGMSKLAKDAGIGRESLYKALKPGAQPRYQTIHKVMNALGMTLQAKPRSAVMQ
ncbi:addiction module antidote protein [Oleidesulfovibrio alaskensis G20]|jgi:probable addiction module antidote protein|uniref:Addiction module antidote protein n=1 Tax=Oleidesulfovibrio alaskensis (strain ATCC BAA-1058 / DSM 17464 / G20) TaxID=207559 RepID=Q315U5_OLEA2|nr:addiction module antidote protein [Oleidesulfovibrio alaskensis]ABB37301.1 addiction module antidote protein [Oleidesulfovibrio alaskensis G20]MBG0773209.1 putative addiction module antidote protein [Oleidesulfovibrio alaskensis]